MSAGGGILLVCTANRARSPMAQLMLARLLPAAPEGIRLRSAGTRAHEGEPVTRQALQVLEARGFDAASFRSRPLTAELVAWADLVLCAERAHRGDVVRLLPRAHRKTFTLAQAARLLSVAELPDRGADSVPALAEALAAARGILPQSVDDDIDDPAGGTMADYERAADRIAAATRAVAGALRRS
ncbi:low molecular weight phosphatase family protein [Microbacterium sp. LjRoot45]|uniref:arsenate reductase/protein-tyrosine-phosphatase family protein n=1 Tax=Microbacterium sp. LjRoot45 TaxID=3342329 RepID=UPI003ED09185